MQFGESPLKTDNVIIHPALYLVLRSLFSSRTLIILCKKIT